MTRFPPCDQPRDCPRCDGCRWVTSWLPGQLVRPCPVCVPKPIDWLAINRELAS